MTLDHTANLVKEWQALHNSHEQYEHFALLIKLVAVVITIVLVSKRWKMASKGITMAPSLFSFIITGIIIDQAQFY